MSFSEILLEVIGYITIFVVLFTSYFAAKLIVYLRKFNTTPVIIFMRFMSVGIILFTIAEILYLISKGAFPSFADVFYVIGTLFFLFSFVFLYIVQEKKPILLKEIVQVIAALAMVIFVLAYFSSEFLLSDVNSSIIEKILNFSYPLFSAIIFLIALLIQTHSYNPSRYIQYIMSAFFLIFLGDIIFVYTSWTNTVSLVIIIQDTFFLLGYLLLFFGIYLFYLKVKRGMKVSKKKLNLQI